MSTKPWDELREQVLSRPGAEERVAEERRKLDAEIEAFEAALAELRRVRALGRCRSRRRWA